MTTIYCVGNPCRGLEQAHAYRGLNVVGSQPLFKLDANNNTQIAREMYADRHIISQYNMKYVCYFVKCGIT